MSKEAIAATMRDFAKTLEKGDVEKALTFFTDDGVWITPIGKFKGKDEIRRYLSSEYMKGLTITEAGNGIIVEGNKAFFEHVIGTTLRGKRVQALVFCAYEFNDGKIKETRSVYDRLQMAQQVAKGWFQKRVINSIVKQSEAL